MTTTFIQSFDQIEKLTYNGRTMKELLHNLGRVIVLISQIIFYSLQLFTSNIASKVTNIISSHLIGEKNDGTKRSNIKSKDDITFI